MGERKLKWIFILILLCGLSAYWLSYGDEYAGWLDRGEVALKQSLVDLTNDKTVLCLAAHPDDEDGATLTYYRKKYGARTIILLATRGEGGQNETGPELYEELGVIRAYETQAAAKIYGAEVYNLNKLDFGFSKSSEETFRIWGHEDSLRRLVQAIREVKPDVIITNHDTEHGHGHHRAVGIIALEAFEAAADAGMFPEQIRDGLRPWQVKRLFLRCGESDADAVIDVGEYDQLRGYSYAQIAGEGLKMHRSQGMGGNVRRGHAYRYYRLVKSSEPAPENLGSLLDGLMDSTETPEFIKGPISMSHDEIAVNVINYIKTARRTESFVPDRQEEELEIATARALDLYLVAEPEDSIVTRGQKLTVRVSLTNCGRQVIEGVKFELHAPRLGEAMGSENLSFQQLGYNETATGTFIVRVFDDAPLTMPYADRLYDDSFMKPLIQVIAQYNAYDTPLSITSEATVDVAAKAELNILPEAVIMPLSADAGRMPALQYVVNLVNRMPGRIEGQIELFPPSGWDAIGMRQDFALAEDQQAFAAFNMNIPLGTASGDFSLEAKALYKTPDGASDAAVAKGTVKVIDVEVADDLYVGYVKSYDDTLEWALNQLNVKSRSLESDDLRFSDLSVYNTIILDIRAYLVRKDLIESNQRLLDYVSDGGNLVVMYNKTYEWNERYAPYKLVLSSDRVTVEESPVTVLVPNHPLFTFPNRITDQDWDGWIQERGLYFPSEWAPQYTELLSCNDPGEKPLRGGYLVAQYGKGTYIYTSYVWYRQLKNLNPGAFRNFANMISIAR